MHLADLHGEYKFNFKHAAISRDESNSFLNFAFWRDFERNRPSLYRMCQIMLQGWKRNKDYPDARVREPFDRQRNKLRSAFNAARWAMERDFRRINDDVSEQIRGLRRQIKREFPIVSRVFGRSPGADSFVVRSPGGEKAGRG